VLIMHLPLCFNVEEAPVAILEATGRQMCGKYSRIVAQLNASPFSSLIGLAVPLSIC